MGAMPVPTDPPPWHPGPRARRYELAADSDQVLDLTEPFPLKLSITEIMP